MAVWYVGSTKYNAIAVWQASTAYVVGDIVRQSGTPTVGQERAFRCTTAGTSGGSQPTWTITTGGLTTDNTVEWTEVTCNEAYGWNAAGLSLQIGFAKLAAGDTLYVSNNHYYAAVLSGGLSGGTSRAPKYIICVDDSSAPPTALATGAFNHWIPNGTLSINGTAKIYGITFRIGSQNSLISMFNLSSGNGHIVFENCILESATSTTSNTTFFQFGGNGIGNFCGGVELINTPIIFGNVAGSIRCSVPMIWRDTPNALGSGVIPTTLFAYGGPSPTNGTANIDVHGVDLSRMSNGKNLVTVGSTNAAKYTFKNCSFGSGLNLNTGAYIGIGGTTIEAINCDQDGYDRTYYRYHSYLGTVHSHRTVVASGGASIDGQQWALEMTCYSGEILSPVYSPYIEYYNTNIGQSQTINIPIITDNVTLNNQEAWLEVDYPGSGAVDYMISGRDSNWLGSPTNHPTDNTTEWITTGLSTPVQQTLSQSFTPYYSGNIRVRVALAKRDTVMYVDPRITKLSKRQYVNTFGIIINEYDKIINYGFNARL